MNYPLYLASDAKYFLNKWQSEIGRIRETEVCIVRQNLKMLYSSYNVMDISIIHSPLLELRSYLVGDKITPHVILPKYIATGNLEFYWAELSGVDLFLTSLCKYNHPISGNEIHRIACDTTDMKQDRLYSRLNVVIRKFLSYQYISLNV